MPEEFDRDLQSIQEARRLGAKAAEAQRVFATFNQYEVDTVVGAMAEAVYRASEKLARLAKEETGIGNVPHKIVKNQFGSKVLGSHQGRQDGRRDWPGRCQAGRRDAWLTAW
jgi:acyl-CoA reductase-like NAD-dependent aldehyde dehydrogenase